MVDEEEIPKPKEEAIKFPIHFSKWTYPGGETKIKQWIEEKDYRHALLLGIKIVPVLTLEG